jgi:plastocyanin
MIKRISQHALLLIMLTVVVSSVARGGTIVGKVTCKGLRSNADVVVYVEAIEGKAFPAATDTVVMDQKGMMFVPHVLPVQVGTTVNFLNSDPVLHNVFTPDKCAAKFNLGSWPQGQVRSYTFDHECIAAVLCNVHPEMEGFVVALPTPYFAVTDKQGTYTIEGVPEGSYTLATWHQKLKPISHEVTVPSDSSVVDFELKK